MRTPLLSITRKTLAVTALAVIVLAGAIRAQNYGWVQINSVPSTLAASTATNQSAIIDMRSHRALGVMVAAAGAGATSGTVTAHFWRSVDSVNWETQGGFDAVLQLNGTSSLITITNLDSGGIGYIKLAYVTNSAAVTVTNLAVQYSLRPWGAGDH